MTDPFEKSVEEIAKQLPIREIYQDGLSGATKQVGHTLTDITKTIRLALAPFQALGALQDRFEKFIDRSVRRVPEQQRISPAPQVIGPVLEGIRFEPEGTPIDEMFSQLLSRSMDAERVNEAHPSFPFLIRQLSSDEAKCLAALKDKTFDRVYTLAFNHITRLFFGEPSVEIDDFPRHNLTFPENVGFYFQHFDKLGLAGIFQQGNQETLAADKSNPQIQTGIRVRCKYRLTDFGHRFVTACIGDS